MTIALGAGQGFAMPPVLLATLMVCAIPALAQEPDTIRASQLPPAIKSQHVCAKATDEVDVSRERYAKAVVFIVSCAANDAVPDSVAIYVARDNKGAGAKRVVFPGLGADGKEKTFDVLPSASPARELDGEKTKNDPPWISAAWQPMDRPGICMVAAQWRLNGDEAELFLWEEAKECSASDGPEFESKVDRKPPPLTGP